MGRKQRRVGRRNKKINNAKAEAEPGSSKVREEEKFVPHFPDEIFVSILSGLPPNSLARFRCVSKEWHSMISDIRATKTARQMVVVISKLGEASYTLRSIDPESINASTVRKPWEKRNPFGFGCTVRICGVCNGLLLIGVDDNLFLWNPLIKYCKKVLSYEPLRGRHDHFVSGLLYDSAAHEYKAVMAFGSKSFAVVGSFRSESWTGIPFPYNVLEVNPGPVVNGYLHWCTNRTTYGHFPSPNQIIYFNPRMGKFEKVPMPKSKHAGGDVVIGLGKFEKVPMPKSKHAGGDMVIGLGALDRCLCMSRMSNPWSENDKTVEVLAMKEYGVEQTWTIMYVISNLTSGPEDVLVPLCCTKKGEALVVIRRKKQDPLTFSWHMEAYNPIDDSHKDIPIPTSRDYLIPARDSEVEAVAYEESLVRPTGYDWEEEDMRGEATYVEYFPNASPQEFKRDRDGHWKFVHGI